MDISTSDLRIVDGALSLDGTVVHVRCPACGFHHEHDVSPPADGKAIALFDLGDMKLPDLGVHRSRCVDGPRMSYQVVQTDWLGSDQVEQASKQDLIRARALGLRQRQEQRAARRLWLAKTADAAKRARARLREERARSEISNYQNLLSAR